MLLGLRANPECLLLVHFRHIFVHAARLSGDNFKTFQNRIADTLRKSLRECHVWMSVCGIAANQCDWNQSKYVRLFHPLAVPCCRSLVPSENSFARRITNNLCKMFRMQCTSACVICHDTSPLHFYFIFFHPPSLFTVHYRRHQWRRCTRPIRHTQTLFFYCFKWYWILRVQLLG